MIDAVRIEARGERAVAWAMYLDATRGLDGVEYLVVEPFEWRRLGVRLDAIRDRVEAAERMLGVVPARVDAALV